MYGITPSEAKIMRDLVKELNEFNSYVKTASEPFAGEFDQGKYFYAFNPTKTYDKETYQKNIRLVSTINDVLDENCINVNNQGYTYLRDAICIVTDRKRLDVCMANDVYPLIADKYRIKSKYRVEHSIRNALACAYDKCRRDHPDRDCIMNSFDRKPTNKKFILRAVQEVGLRLLKELTV